MSSAWETARQWRQEMARVTPPDKDSQRAFLLALGRRLCEVFPKAEIGLVRHDLHSGKKECQAYMLEIDQDWLDAFGNEDFLSIQAKAWRLEGRRVSQWEVAVDDVMSVNEQWSQATEAQVKEIRARAEMVTMEQEVPNVRHCVPGRRL